MNTRALGCCIGVVLLAAQSASAQEDRSRWGVSGAFVPVWEVPPEGKVLFDSDAVDMQGGEFRIGFVRGRDLGGDWGVSFVRKTIDDGSTVGAPGEECFAPFGCGTFGTQYVYRNVTLTGVEIHKFVPFATIARRVQIGMNFAGGVARFEGRTDEYRFDPFVTEPGTGTFSVANRPPIVTEGGAEAEDLFVVKPVPLGKVEVAVAGIIPGGLKVRVSGGFNFPGYQVGSVTLVYLFGTR